MNFLKKQELLAKIPQPPAAPYPFGHFFWLRQHKTPITKLAYQHRGQYGDVMLARLGPRNMVVISDVNMVKQILQHDPDNYNKGRGLSTLDRWLGKSLVLSEGATWAKKRDLMSHAFKRSKLATFLPTFHDVAKELGEVWETAMKNGEVIDLHDHFTRLTLDVITRTSFSYDVKAVKSKEMTEAARFLIDILDGLELQVRSLPSLLAPPWLYFNTKQGKHFDKAINAFKVMTEKVIEKRMQKIANKEPPYDKGLNELDAMLEAGTAPEMDLLDLMMLGAHESAKEKGFPSIGDLSQEVQLFLFAGHETTSTTMAWIAYYLTKNPEYEAKVLQEIEDVMGPKGEKVNVRTLSNLKYMTQVIKETLRLKSPVFGFSRVPKTDVELGKYTIPAGTQCLVNAYAIHRKEEYWGEKTEEFNPDRQNPEIQRPQFSWIPFAAGARNCIGQQFAMMEIKTVLSYLLPRFKFELVNEPGEETKLLLRPRDLNVRIQNRV